MSLGTMDMTRRKVPPRIRCVNAGSGRWRWALGEGREAKGKGGKGGGANEGGF